MKSDRCSPIPEGQVITPYLIVKGAAKALAFYQRAFGAAEVYRLDDPDGRVGHAEMTIGRGRFTLADEYPEMNCLSPATLGGSGFLIAVYVEDVDALVERALSEGAVLERPVADEFHGDRVAIMKDPFGHRWSFASRYEEVSPGEMKRRMAAGAEGDGSPASERSGVR